MPSLAATYPTTLRDAKNASLKALSSGVEGSQFAHVLSTGRSSEYFGVCELCAKDASDVFCRKVYREFHRRDGTAFFAPGWSNYGHEACLLAMPAPVSCDAA